ncbi:MAG: efflux RND transporter periplasmic adaptor subunit [Victivallaceae bacterium]
MILKVLLLFFVAVSGVNGLAAEIDVSTGYTGLPVKTVLFPFRQAVISSIVDTQVKSYKFKEGERFQDNALLIELDDSIYLQKLDRAKSAYLEANTSMDFADKNCKRSQEMFEKGIQGRQELEKSELDLQVSKAKLEFAVANMKLAEIELKACRISAPFKGRLIKKIVQEHEYVRSGQPLMNVIDDNLLLAVVHLPSEEKKLVSVGQAMWIKIDETGTVHNGKVYEIAGDVDPGSRTFELKILLDNREGALSAGMSGELMKRNTVADAIKAAPVKAENK